MFDVLGIAETVTTAVVGFAAGEVTKSALNAMLPALADNASKSEVLVRKIGTSVIGGAVGTWVAQTQVKPVFRTLRGISKGKYSNENNNTRI
jgi:hypothetical protein